MIIQRIAIALTVIAPFTIALQAETEEAPTFSPFTGQVTAAKVRLRLHPNLESPVLRQLDQSELVLVEGENNDFYAVKPPADLKAYVYRTYVLDGQIEGNHVNVRLAPNLDAPIIAQLNSGDRVEGTIHANDTHWLEISLPPATYLWVAKNYVEKVGDRDHLVALEKRKTAVQKQLKEAEEEVKKQLNRPFPEIQLDEVLTNLHTSAKSWDGFPEQQKAYDLYYATEEKLIFKKLEYLESLASSSTNILEAQGNLFAREMEQHKNRVAELEEELREAKASREAQVSYKEWIEANGPNEITNRSKSWAPAEIHLYNTWNLDNEGSIDDFYADQEKQAIQLRGIVEPYERSIFNKPGDFILINRITRQPICYLYSTRINLQSLIGQEVTVYAAERPNNHFAFPAYFVTSVE